jgi:uncharacterized protein (TIGR02145 family)
METRSVRRPGRGFAHGILAALGIGALSVAMACSSTSPDESAQESELREDGGREGGREGGSEGGADASADGSAGSYLDPRDSQTYPTMKLGEKTWLARNLNFAIAGSSFCYADDSRNCAIDGRLYTFTTARTACPPAWHLSSDDDWKSLEAALGMPAAQLGLEGYSTVRGRSEGTTFKAGAHMAGYRAGTDYDALGDRTYFWTSTTRGADVWRRRVQAAESTIYRFTNPPGSFAISVRCVKD